MNNFWKTITEVENHTQSKTVGIKNKITYNSDDNNNPINTTVIRGSINGSLPLSTLSHNENYLSDNKSYSYIVDKM